MAKPTTTPVGPVMALTATTTAAALAGVPHPALVATLAAYGAGTVAALGGCGQHALVGMAAAICAKIAAGYTTPKPGLAI